MNCLIYNLDIKFRKGNILIHHLELEKLRIFGFFKQNYFIEKCVILCILFLLHLFFVIFDPVTTLSHMETCKSLCCLSNIPQVPCLPFSCWAIIGLECVRIVNQKVSIPERQIFFSHVKYKVVWRKT